MIAATIIWSVIGFCFLWWITYCYYGKIIAMILSIMIIVSITIIMYKISKKPSEQELNTFQVNRKGVGY